MGFDIVVVVLVLVLAYQVHQLREARKPRLKPKVLKALLEGEPIKVKHNTPRSHYFDRTPIWRATTGYTKE